MKTNKTPIIAAFAFLCFCFLPALVAGVASFYLQDRPPGNFAESGYYVRRTRVFYYPGFGVAPPFEIDGADVDSFVILDGRYATDINRAYFVGNPIEDSNPATFELLKDSFARDSRHVYVNGTIFSNDPANFEHVNAYIYRDSRHIYWSTTPISDDPEDLIVIGDFGFYTYFKDSQRVFINGAPIEAADPATFEIIGDGYSRDGENAFYVRDLIPHADLATLEPLVPPYARDRSTAYWMGKPIPDSDPDTFKILNADFECSADVAHAYYRDRLIRNFDPNTIPTGADVVNCDESAIYFNP